jgi:uncharacterized protein YecE (DUF72 family)
MGVFHGTRATARLQIDSLRDMRDPAVGSLYVGTSGFAYPDWAPRFYPSGTRAADLLSVYASRLTAVELNNTFYRQPSPKAIETWLAATPDTFRFAVKAQRGASWRAFRGAAAESVPWLTAAYRPFGERLRCVLFRVEETTPRDDDALARLLDAWPADLTLALELRHASWEDDEVHDQLRARGVALVTTDTDELEDPPIVRRIGPLLYLRLRRTSYSAADLDDWSARLAPFLDDGIDACVFLRHDADGASAVAAGALLARRQGRA